MNGYYGFDITYLILVLPAILLCTFAQAKVKSTFSKYSSVVSRRGFTGRQAAELVLRMGGVSDVRITTVSGSLTDHYDPKSKVIRLSDPVYGSGSIAAIGVAAHEASHACQHAEGYAPLTMRNAVVGLCNIGSQLSMPMIMLGIVLNFQVLTNLGIILFGLLTVFQVLTLPVEFNASRRALQMLKQDYVLDEEELKATKKVLSAAALTYVGSMLVSLTQLLRLIILFGGRSRDDR